MSRLSCTLESILYLKAQPLTLTELSELAQCDRDEVEEGLLELMSDFSHRETALEVAETPDGYCLQLRVEYQGLVQQIIPADIGVGALRTLAVIAMKGPLLQTDLINLRGSTAYQQVQELVEQGFVRKRRRSDGRSYWLQVTEKFRQYFQLNQLQQQGIEPFGKATKSGGGGAVAADLESDPLDTDLEPMLEGSNLDAAALEATIAAEEALANELMPELVPEEGEIPDEIEGTLADDRLDPLFSEDLGEL